MLWVENNAAYRPEQSCVQGWLISAKNITE